MTTKVLGGYTFTLTPNVDGVLVRLEGEPSVFDPVATPSPPADGFVQYCKNVAGRRLPSFLGPSNFENFFQPSMFASRILQWLPGNSTTVSIAYGDTWTARNSGTSAAQSHPTRSTTNLMTYIKRALFGTGTSTTGASGVQSTNIAAFRGNAAGIGGFFYHSRFGIETFQAAMRVFNGLSANNATMNSEPSTWANTIGIGKDSTDTNWQIISRNASAVTKLNTGIACTAGVVLDFFMFCKANDTQVTVRLVNVGTGAVLLDNTVVNSNLPVNTVGMYAQNHNQSTSGTTAKGLALANIYLESDN